MHCSFRETKPSYDPCAVAANFMLASPPETMAEATALLRPPDFAATSFWVATKTLFPAPVCQGCGKLIAEQRYAPAGIKPPPAG
jgi:hypothetical protein